MTKGEIEAYVKQEVINALYIARDSFLITDDCGVCWDRVQAQIEELEEELKKK